MFLYKDLEQSVCENVLWNVFRVHFGHYTKFLFIYISFLLVTDNEQQNPLPINVQVSFGALNTSMQYKAKLVE